jgi:hypothetical protein
MMSHIARSVTALAVVVCGVTTASADTTLQFDELPSQPADGLGFSGVTFGFEVGGSPSLDATYNVDLGLGSTQFLSDPVLEGDAGGLLTLGFIGPVTELSSVLDSWLSDLTPGAVVDLYDGGDSPDSIGVDTLADPPRHHRGWFDWTATGVGASRVVIDFEDQAGRFALDNLSFNAVPSRAR